MWVQHLTDKLNGNHSLSKIPNQHNFKNAFLFQMSIIDAARIIKKLSWNNTGTFLSNKKYQYGIECINTKFVLQGMDDIIKEMNQSLKKQLREHDIRTSLLDTNKMELLVTTQYVSHKTYT